MHPTFANLSNTCGRHCILGGMTHWRDITPETRIAMKAEAERRARAGESPVDIAQAVGVAISTYHLWAKAGGWRSCDLAAEQDCETAQGLCTGPSLDPAGGEADGGEGQADGAPVLAVGRRCRSSGARRLQPVVVDEGRLSRLEPGMAVRLAAVLAMEAQLRGDIDEAERHARLGERLSRLSANAPYAKAEQTIEEVCAELDAILPLSVDRDAASRDDGGA